jgi:hypothetical protein
MPLARYFLCVGGVLLALLFIVSAESPKVPAPQVTNTAAELPMIRIHTDRKWPERVVFDTSIPANMEPVAILAKAATSASAPPKAPAPTLASDSRPPDLQAKARVREAFAQLQPTEPKQVKHADARKLEVKRPVKRKVARRRIAPPTMMIAQQPTFGFFGQNIW